MANKAFQLAQLPRRFTNKSKQVERFSSPYKNRSSVKRKEKKRFLLESPLTSPVNKKFSEGKLWYKKKGERRCDDVRKARFLWLCKSCVRIRKRRKWNDLAVGLVVGMAEVWERLRVVVNNSIVVKHSNEARASLCFACFTSTSVRTFISKIIYFLRNKTVLSELNMTHDRAGSGMSAQKIHQKALFQPQLHTQTIECASCLGGFLKD